MSKILIALLSVPLFIKLDIKFYEFCKSIKLDFLNTPFNIIGTIFDERLFLILSVLLILLYLSKFKLFSDLNKKRIIHMFISNLIIILVTITLKLIFYRERPYVSGNPYNFFMFRKSYKDFLSFPSGHVLVSTSVHFIHRNKLLSYFLMFLIALSRLLSLKHWLSDVLASCLISLFIIHDVERLK